MPTKKPRVQTILEVETYNKFKALCEKEMRTESQLSSYIITNYINNYEKEHGNIKINMIKNDGTIHNVNM
jgi:hypothetical protein